VQRVLDSVAALGYRRNAIASAMMAGRTQMIGVLSQTLGENSGAILGGALDESAERDYAVKVVCGYGEYDCYENAMKGIERCVELRLAGMLAFEMDAGLQHDIQAASHRYSIPVVIVDSSFAAPGISRVITDDVSGVRQAVTHLVDLGHRRIAMIGGDPKTGAAVLREETFYRCLQEYGLPTTGKHYFSDFENDALSEAAANALLTVPNAAERPTAIVCISDAMAMVVTRTARRLGFNVPQDLSITGFADFSMARRCDPPLTTVKQPFYDMGRLAARRLFELVDGEEEKEEGWEGLVPTHLIVRESTAPPPF